MWKCPNHDGIDPGCPECAKWLKAHSEEKGKLDPNPERHPLITQDSLRFKKIYDYTDAELEFAIEDAVEHAKNPGKVQVNARETRATLDFWRLLRGFDAYIEKRRRRDGGPPKIVHQQSSMRPSK